MSASEYARDKGVPLHHAAYHFGELEDAAFIDHVATRVRRGGVEYVYEPRKLVLAWSDQWAAFSPKVKRSILSSVMQGSVEALGSAIDRGTFEAHDDSHLSWDSMEVDEAGWLEVADILDRALRLLVELRATPKARNLSDDEHFLASYFISSFESPFARLRVEDDAIPLQPVDPSYRRAPKVQRVGDDSQVLAKAFSHRTRVRILMAMTAPRRQLSPELFARETGLRLSHVDYHYQVLEDLGFVQLVATRPRRGATEHIYEAKKSALAWTDEWRLLGPAVQQRFLAAVMRGGVEMLSRAIEGGTFEARDESHLSFDTINVDRATWTRIGEILDGALGELLEVKEACRKRIRAGAKAIVVSYFMAGFESAEKIALLARED
jgi:DNA-binding transcriptional ArsR family regulator